MLYLYTGTDREKARAALNVAVASASGAKKARVVRITDANIAADLSVALAGRGMFGEKRVVVLEGVLGNEEMRNLLLDRLPDLARSDEAHFLFEEKPDAATRKRLEKYAETSERFDSAKKEAKEDFFATAQALLSGDKKTRWVALHRELAKDAAPEMIHGVMFWRAKNIFMKARDEGTKQRGKMLIAELAELPHEARRRGEELEYALERFALSEM